MILIDEKTLEEWNTEIDGYDISDLWQDVFPRLYPNQDYDNKNRSPREGSEYYQRIDVFQMIAGEKVFATKLPYADYLTEQDLVKQELKDAKAAEFADLELEQQVKDILDSIPELNVAIAELSLNQPNALLYKALLIQERDLEQANALKVAYDAWRASQDILEAEENSINDGVAKIEIGKKIIAYINFLNRQKNLTIEQFQTILADTDLQLIERLCLNGSLSSVRFQVNAYQPDGVIMLEDDKTKILAYMDRVGA